jgi:hypothetical protein
MYALYDINLFFKFQSSAECLMLLLLLKDYIDNGYAYQCIVFNIISLC